MTRMSCTIGGVTTDPCIMNAPYRGAITYDELATIGKSESGAIVTAPMTVKPEGANPEPNYYDYGWGAVSSVGFPNLGYKQYGELIPKLKEFGKPVVATLTGPGMEEYVEMAGYISKKGPDIVLLDLQYPNALDGRSVGYRWDYMEVILKELRKLVSQPLGFNVPVMFDPMSIEILFLAAMRARIDFVTAIPPVRTGLVIDVEQERSVIKSSESDIGRQSGAIIKPLALANVKLLFDQLGKIIPVIGSGGIANGTDVFEFLLDGACAVQVDAALPNEGVQAFSRIRKELTALMERKGYAATADVVGKLKS